ncbi:MAG: type II toxin-antitoxin system VapC family toxin [Chloroflexi bacterium]|nr:type II toxin-antitoxin system VapC family toxin [Chloroflexota bacterium]
MSGSSLLLDTNAFIYFFEGRRSVTQLVAQAPIVYYCPISEIELLSSSRLSQPEILQIKAFLALCERIDLSSEVVALTIRIRREYKQKIPDAIVAASALFAGVPLVTADADFKNIDVLNLITDILS